MNILPDKDHQRDQVGYTYLPTRFLLIGSVCSPKSFRRLRRAAL